MTEHTVVSKKLWQAARKTLLEKEKAFSKQRDELAAQTRALPWTRVDKNYIFEGPDCCESLAELFAQKSQLIIYHFMFGEDWDVG